jgi:hypothetical protein
VIAAEPVSALFVAVAGEEVDALLAKGQAGAHILAALGGDRTAKQPPTNLAALRATAEVPTSMQAAVLHAWLLIAHVACAIAAEMTTLCLSADAGIAGVIRARSQPWCTGRRCSAWPTAPSGGVFGYPVASDKLMSDWVKCACVIPYLAALSWSWLLGICSRATPSAALWTLRGSRRSDRAPLQQAMSKGSPAVRRLISWQPVLLPWPPAPASRPLEAEAPSLQRRVLPGPPCRAPP